MSNERICAEATKEYYPDKITVQEFANEIVQDIGNFAVNIMDIQNNGGLDPKMFPEEWIKLFAAWMEMK
jgi:hypothetical protein